MPERPPGKAPSGSGRRGGGERPIDGAALARECRLAGARLAAIEDELDRFGGEVRETRRALLAIAEAIGRGAGLVPPLRSPRSAQEEHVLRAEADAGCAVGPAHDVHARRAEAAAGAASVDVVRGPDGASSISLGGRRAFPLPPQLAALAAVLATPGGTTYEGLAGWWARSQVATALNKRTGSALKAEAVPRLVWKLKECFREAGENWHLVQSHRRWGVRLAIRPATGGDPGGSAPVGLDGAADAAGIQPRRPRRRARMC